MSILLLILLMTFYLSRISQVSTDKSWSVPDSLNLGIINFPDSLFSQFGQVRNPLMEFMLVKSNILEVMIKAKDEEAITVNFIKTKNSPAGSFMFLKNELLKDSEQGEVRYRIPIAKASFFVENKTLAPENTKGEIWYLKINNDGLIGILTKNK